jgi:hypothetical protein
MTSLIRFRIPRVHYFSRHSRLPEILAGNGACGIIAPAIRGALQYEARSQQGKHDRYAGDIRHEIAEPPRPYLLSYFADEFEIDHVRELRFEAIAMC